jgi:hypothetical protein
MDPTSGRPLLLDRLQGSTLRGLEEGFQQYGEFVADHPFGVIAACLALTLLCGGGLYWFRAENEGQLRRFVQRYQQWIRELMNEIFQC